MNSRDFESALAGGYVTSHSLSLAEKELSFCIEVLDRGQLSRYALSLEGVSFLQLNDESKGKWERIELTEILVEREPGESQSEEWEIRCNFWETASMTIHCLRIRLDGDLIQ